MKETFKWDEMLHELSADKTVDVPRSLWNRDEDDIGILDEAEGDRWDIEGALTGFEEGAEHASDEPFDVAEADDA